MCTFRSHACSIYSALLLGNNKHLLITDDKPQLGLTRCYIWVLVDGTLGPYMGWDVTHRGDDDETAGAIGTTDDGDD